MKKKNYLTGLVIVLIFILFSCSSEVGECDVVYDADADLCFVRLYPPGETGESYQEGTFQRKTTMSRDPGGPIKRVAIYTLDNLTRRFDESGNVYTIKGEIHLHKENGDADILKYDLTVTGGVYGNSPRQFVKEK